ncbi:hypothetical protein HAX54_014258, partial [Datura stramonium]|nr:hypothetical protein [Datura stramonium]
ETIVTVGVRRNKTRNNRRICCSGFLTTIEQERGSGRSPSAVKLGSNKWNHHRDSMEIVA